MRLAEHSRHAWRRTWQRYVATLVACCCALALNMAQPFPRALAQTADQGGTPLLLAPESHGSRHGSRHRRHARAAAPAKEQTATAEETQTEAAPTESRRHGRHRHWSRHHGRGTRATAAAEAPAASQTTDDADAADQNADPGKGPVSVTLLTGALGSTSSRMASDLGAVLDGPNLRVMPMLGKSAGQNLTDLADAPNVDVALVQADTLGGRGKPAGVSYLARLYNEEVHLVAGPTITDIRQLAGQRVAVDTVSDDSTATASALFGRLGIKIIQVELDLPAALAKLKSGDVAAVLTISGKPSPGLASFDSTGGYHLLAVPYAGPLQDAYYPGRLDNSDYPNLVPPGAGLETVAVGTLLAVHDVPRGSARYKRVAAFTQAFFAKFDALRDPARHPKWREVNLAADVPGWSRFGAATEALAKVPEQKAASIAAAPPAEARSAAAQPNEFDRFVADHTGGANMGDLSSDEQDRLLREFQKWKRKHKN